MMRRLNKLTPKHDARRFALGMAVLFVMMLCGWAVWLATVPLWALIGTPMAEWEIVALPAALAVMMVGFVAYAAWDWTR